MHPLALTLALTLQAAPVRWSVTAPDAKTTVKPGGRVAVTLLAEIQEGWHLYSLKKTDGGPIPTSISVPEGQPFRQAGEIEAPPPLVAFEETFGMDVESYRGSVEFVVPVEVMKDAKAGAAALAVNARYQVCDDKQCLPPRTVKLELPLLVTAPSSP